MGQNSRCTHQRRFKNTSLEDWSRVLKKLQLEKRLLGVNWSYVDDVLRARNSKLKIVSKIILRKFETAPLKIKLFRFAGLKLRQLPYESFHLYQSFHIKKIIIMSDDEVYSMFYSRKMMLPRSESSIPHFCLELSQRTLITREEQSLNLICSIR